MFNNTYETLVLLFIKNMLETRKLQCSFSLFKVNFRSTMFNNTYETFDLTVQLCILRDLYHNLYKFVS